MFVVNIFRNKFCVAKARLEIQFPAVALEDATSPTESFRGSVLCVLGLATKRSHKSMSVNKQGPPDSSIMSISRVSGEMKANT